MTLILGIIIVVAVVGYAIFFYLQRKYAQEIVQQQQQVSTIIQSSLNDDLTNMKEVHLSGETLEHFEQTKQSYLYLVNHRLPEISERLKELQEACSHYRFLAVKRELDTIAAKLRNASELQKKTNREIVNLKSSNQLHQKKRQELEQQYQKLRKTLLAKNFSFGPSIDQLEENLSNLEAAFDHYGKLARQGDYLAADQELRQLEKNTTVLAQQIKQIPPLYRNLKNVFPEQLTELGQGAQQLAKQKYGFKQDLSTELTGLQSALAENIIDLKELKLSIAIKRDQEINQQINDLYDLFEAEIKARQTVQQQRPKLKQFIRHARLQERELLVELERLQQNYTFNHHEMENGRKLENQLNQLEHNFKQTEQDILEGKPIYSAVLLQQQEQAEKLVVIEKQQTEINQSIQGLWHEEKAARQAAQEFDLEIHRIRRQLGKQNLPGLPKDYLEFFFAVSKSIEQLMTDLEQLKIDLAAITKQLLDIQADLDKLAEKANDITDSAALAEILLQYANRYKTRYPEVAQAAQQAGILFNQKFAYAASLEKIATAIDQVEPGAYQKLEDEYYAKNPKK
ncbi:septation ring formation regulator EzrA [Liquorilactobacillus nagelii]|jgi:septation ring formation regulator|uniref:septation ring formation regulator EzrA n=1 Tax=Liquorilactobacillus nagelii TaxID=82688 RepID=UPI0039EB3B9F